jgi:hypothetical protein
MPGYTITDTKEASTITPGGGRKQVYRVWLVTERGATGMAVVEKADWTAEKLPAILTAKAAELDLAFTLGG